MLTNRVATVLLIVALLAAAAYHVWVGEVSPWVYVSIVAVFMALQTYGSIVLSAQFFIPVRFRGTKESHSIALTFDDGPLQGHTERILDILKQHNVKAAFFCIGHRVTSHPDVVARIHAEGHVVGNHSYWHGKLFDLQSSSAIRAELEHTNAAVEAVIRKRPRFFRPPYGVTNPMVAAAVRKLRYTTIGWSLRSFDSVSKDSSVLRDKVARLVKAGDVILFHDYSEAMIAMLPQFLKHVEDTGLKIVRVDELLQEQAYA